MFSNLSLAFVLIGSFFASLWTGNYSHLFKKYTVHGIDVSHHQSYINWEKVASHDDFKVKFCFMKATEGASHKDTQFKNYWVKSKEAKLVRGAYHFYSHSSSPQAQANHYISMVKLEAGDLAPVLDFETESSSVSIYQTRKNLLRWLATVENHYKIKPIIYTNSHIYQKYIKGYFDDYKFWIADYNVSDIAHKMTDKNVLIWQYTERGRVSGISTHVDVNAFLGQERDFESLRIPYPSGTDSTYAYGEILEVLE